jgi:hypothetical protein
MAPSAPASLPNERSIVRRSVRLGSGGDGIGLWWRNTRFPRNFASPAAGESADAGRTTDATKVRVEVQRGGRRRLGWLGPRRSLGQSWGAQVQADGGFTHRVFSNGDGQTSRPGHCVVAGPTATRSRETFRDPGAIGRDRDLGHYAVACSAPSGSSHSACTGIVFRPIRSTPLPASAFGLSW